MTTSLFVRSPWGPSTASILVIPPTEEPLTLAEGKLRAGLDWPDGDPRDDLMRSLIAAARAKVEQDTGLALLTQTRDVYYHEPIDPWAVLPLPSQATPLQSLTPIDPAGTALAAVMVPPPIETLATAPYAIGRSGGIPSIVTTTLWPVEAVGYRIVSGWPSAQSLAAHAPGLVHAVGLLTAHYATVGRDLTASGAVESVPYGYEDAIAAHRLIWVA